MSKPACICHVPDWQWRKQGCNEQGWHCESCNLPAPNPRDLTKPGYRPDLDRAECLEKVNALIFWLHEEDFVYISNGDMGDRAAALVADKCKRQGRYDQASMLRYITALLDDDKGAFWANEAKQWLEGRTPPKPAEEQCNLPF